MCLDLSKIAVVADVVTDAILINIRVVLRFAGQRFHRRERLQNGARVVIPSPHVVDFAGSRRFTKCQDQVRNVLGMNVVANLLSFVSKNLILTLLEIAAHEIAQETV